MLFDDFESTVDSLNMHVARREFKCVTWRVAPGFPTEYYFVLRLCNASCCYPFKRNAFFLMSFNPYSSALLNNSSFVILPFGHAQCKPDTTICVVSSYFCPALIPSGMRVRHPRVWVRDWVAVIAHGVSSQPFDYIVVATPCAPPRSWKWVYFYSQVCFFRVARGKLRFDPFRLGDFIQPYVDCAPKSPRLIMQSHWTYDMNLNTRVCWDWRYTNLATRDAVLVALRAGHGGPRTVVPMMNLLKFSNACYFNPFTPIAQKKTFSQPLSEMYCDVVRADSIIISSEYISYEKPSSSYCVM